VYVSVTTPCEAAGFPLPMILSTTHRTCVFVTKNGIFYTKGGSPPLSQVWPKGMGISQYPSRQCACPQENTLFASDKSGETNRQRKRNFTWN
jgi:hypothetical protein